jgi:pantetheine-phosphate adenylyltransferase
VATFKKVAVGGTFDELHKGHRTLLSAAFEVGQRVVIGLTSDELVREMNKPHMTAPLEERKRERQAWLRVQGWSDRAEIIPLYDAFGSTIRDAQIEALVVSQETSPNAWKINEQRAWVKLKPLKIVAINMVPSQNCRPISTTLIRRGEMDKEGRILRKTLA